MFSSAYQGLQLCLEAGVVESHFLRLKLAPSAIILKPTELESTSCDEEKSIGVTDDDDNNNGSDCKPIVNRHIDIGGWRFLQSLASRKDSTEHNEVYVHPLAKSSACNLSEKSLHMCTESLGSETGSEISDCSDDILFLSSETVGRHTPKPRENFVTRRMSCSGSTTGRGSSFPPPLTSISGSGSTVYYNPLNTRRMSRSSSTFPPPLTSISGSNGVRVTSHREGGRLVLQAVSAPTCNTYMHAERSEGRLRLCLLKQGTPSTPIFDDQDGEEADNGEEGEVNEEQSEGRLSLFHSKDTTATTPIFNDKNGKDEEQERDEVAKEDKVVNEENGTVQHEVEEEKCHWADEGMDVKTENIGGKIWMGKLARASSCKERPCRHEGFLTWEPYFVAA
ncbi:hypothetical protein F3Y22_tig00112614pilonHSYRG00065 [Hibiscus syriacus]|uniref:FAF domain-containing protein n=1 Tax=Hibiscus syriacus TaxID=106335 RepID=A0A6A2WVY5_HIBSY|nr:protein FANTASTIC FOUR 1-like [Hibiscus syriacus]KAE8665441.1 hypothetical protein F3Y22_tig00112614pilonHSYRG00065 [Hibiscus syriacus]